MVKPPNPRDWLAGFVVPDAPRGEEALALTQALVDTLGSPQRHAPAVHIVGTAGKGAVAARLTSRLVAASLDVATHQSPHVYDVRERFLINGELPPWSDIDGAIAEVDAAAEQVALTHGRKPTFFAITAALSWVLGRRYNVDMFVTEAGIGGRVDATAVLDRSDTITVVTHLGLDHTEALGSTVEAIAAEKAAVLAGRRVAVLGPQSSDAAVDVVRDVAQTYSVELVETGPVDGDWRAHADATAEATLQIVASLVGRPVPPAPTATVPGRFEERSVADRRVVLDGAHNPMKLDALAEVLAHRRPAAVIAAVGSSKDLDRCATALVSLGGPVIAVDFGGDVGPRSWPRDALAEAVHAADGTSEVGENPRDAVRRALRHSAPGDTILVTGSFLILSDVASAFAEAEGS